jgi:hypothetical protein
MEERFLFESNRNPYHQTNGKSKFAEKHILLAITFLKEYMKADNYEVKEESTYVISLPTGKDVLIASFSTLFKSKNRICNVEVSNPYAFKGVRYWTSFKGKKYWTDKGALESKQVNPELVFDLFAENYDAIYEKYVLAKKASIAGKEVSKEDKIFEDSQFDEWSYHDPGVDYNTSVTREVKENLAFKIFKKIFKQ